MSLEWREAARTLRLGVTLPEAKTGTFCSDHGCSHDCTNSEGPCACCTKPCQAAEHVLFLHTEKTGGSAVECASQPLVQAGLWTNMGHAGRPSVSACTAHCPSSKTLLVLSVRNPYDYWTSLFKYGRRGVNSAIANALPHEYFETFPTFVGHVATPEQFKWSLTFRVQRACGNPCVFDFLLHTETLAADWSRLLTSLELPQIPLQRVNVGLHNETAGLDWKTMSTDISRKVTKLEWWIFATFGYAKRQGQAVQH